MAVMDECQNCDGRNPLECTGCQELESECVCCAHCDASKKVVGSGKGSHMEIEMECEADCQCKEEPDSRCDGCVAADRNPEKEET